jgi:hypothetical protein
LASNGCLEDGEEVNGSTTLTIPSGYGYGYGSALRRDESEVEGFIGENSCER